MVAEAVTGAPDVEHLQTRAIDERSIARGYVRSTEVQDISAGGIALRTVDAWSTGHTDWLGAERFEPEQTSGALRIDVVSDDVLRIRYLPDADHVEEGERDLGIVVGSLPSPSSVEVEGTTLRTPAMVVEVELRPFSVRVTSPDGLERCRISGREKNMWGMWDTHSTGVSRTAHGRTPLATETYALRPGEAVFGFGEQFGRLNKVGQTVDVNMVEAVGTTTPRAYKNIPFFWTTGGYGVFWNTTGRMTAWIGSRNAADVQIAAEDEQLDTYVFVGDPKTILDRYTTLTGKAHVPPDWSFGWWQSKISYKAADEVLDVVRRHRAADLPMDVIHLDTFWFSEDWRNDLTFSEERFPDPAGFLAELRDMGVHTCLWQLPYIPEGSPLFDELAEAGA
ncbi:MAG: TIM-barrel domain-containing protein, partial [Acidimicrobiales bacterium]